MPHKLSYSLIFSRVLIYLLYHCSNPNYGDEETHVNYHH